MIRPVKSNLVTLKGFIGQNKFVNFNAILKNCQLLYK